MTSRGPTFGRVDGYTPSAQSAPKSGASVPERARTDEPIVYVVDDETSIRNSTKELAESVGLRVQTFATAQDFLHIQRPDVPGCLVLDVRLPGLINPRRRLTTSPARFTSWTISSSPSRAWARSGC